MEEITKHLVLKSDGPVASLFLNIPSPFSSPQCSDPFTFHQSPESSLLPTGPLSSGPHSPFLCQDSHSCTSALSESWAPFTSMLHCCSQQAFFMFTHIMATAITNSSSTPAVCLRVHPYFPLPASFHNSLPFTLCSNFQNLPSMAQTHNAHSHFWHLQVPILFHPHFPLSTPLPFPWSTSTTFQISLTFNFLGRPCLTFQPRLGSVVSCLFHFYNTFFSF